MTEQLSDLTTEEQCDRINEICSEFGYTSAAVDRHGCLVAWTEEGGAVTLRGTPRDAEHGFTEETNE